MSRFLKISEQLLCNVKMYLSFDEKVSDLTNFKYSDLILELDSDDKKKTFWINIYNSFYQILAIKILNKSIFKAKIINIGGNLLSLDDIEHGILRKGQFVIGFGYLKNPFYSKFIQKLQVEKLDYRIHFAMNCGALSCPPILVYQIINIEKQLQLATASFITSESDIDYDQKTITTSKLFYWYKADFGSNTKIKLILSNVFNEDLHDFKIEYKPYNWDKHLNNFY